MNISPAIQRTLSRATTKLSKYSPQILTVAGVAGLAVAGILAAKNTLKLETTLDVARERLDEVQSSPEATQKDVNKVYVRNALDLGKLYWAPTTLAVASTVSILAAHNILHKRNIALVAAYKGLEQTFNDYRKRVVEEYGTEVDEKFSRGIRDVETVDENGKKVRGQSVDASNNAYILEFGPGNDNWTGNHDHNEFYVTRAQNYFNDILPIKGHVFLQDVTRHLGLPDSKVGAVTGWVYKAGSGDDYIDFGIKDFQDTLGYIQLNPNVDGMILDLI
jgi:hypothetical protein